MRRRGFLRAIGGAIAATCGLISIGPKTPTSPPRKCCEDGLSIRRVQFPSGRVNTTFSFCPCPKGRAREARMLSDFNRVISRKEPDYSQFFEQCPDGRCRRP